MKKVLKIGLLVIILGVFVWTIIFLYNKSRTKPQVFETKTPAMKSIVKKTVATGSIVPRKEIEIKPQVSGIIKELYVKAGVTVRKGDLIAKVEVIPDMISLNNAESRVNRAKINFEDSKLVFDRQKQLYDKGVIAEAEFLRNKLEYNNAREELDAAENNLQLIKEGVSKRAGQITNTLVRSTVDGMVLDVPVEEGNSVIESNTFNAGTTIATVANMGEMIFKGKVDETEVGKIKPGMNLLLSIGAIEVVKFNAELEYISPKGVEENGAIQFEIKAKVHLVDTVFIRAGYSANADIVLDRRENVMSIEEGLIIFENDTAYVEVETAPQKFEKRRIEVGLSDGINIEVKSGIKMKDKLKVYTVKEEETKPPA